MAQAAAPWIMGGIGALSSSAGSKKAAKAANKGPSIPQEFRPAVLDATSLLQHRMQRGFPSFTQPGGDVLSLLQGQAGAGMRGIMGQGGQGYDAALKTMTDVAATGMNPADVEFIRSQMQPFFDFQFQRGLGQARESQAQGGRFFGSGGVSAENDFTNQFLANQSATILPLAMQNRQLQLSAAQGIPQGFAQMMGGFGLGAQAGEVERLARLQEFVRTQPENAIPLLASLMGGTPMFQPAVPQNFWQSLGGMSNSLLTSPGFWQMLQGGASTPGAGPSGAGQWNTYGAPPKVLG